MADIIEGKVYVLGDDIDTDQIIPAEYLMYDPSDPQERRYFGMYALSGVPTDQAGLPDGHQRFVPEGQFEGEYRIIIGGRNFGCGSSREHAPLALAEAGCRAVVAEFYARIFFRNCVNGGYVLPCETDRRLVDQFRTGQQARIDLDNHTLTNLDTGQAFSLKPLGDVKPIIDAGGIFDYAKQTGML
jgi:3-isopropylmalate/(R)-2-methylmalate dehydratase small subunit